MSLLNLLFVFAMAAPQQSPAPTVSRIQQRLPGLTYLSGDPTARKLLESSQVENTCYSIRSYHFRRQDGQAPVPDGMTTCTRANVFQQRQLTSIPPGLFVPLGMKIDQTKAADHK
jgi:hypothetical protein